MLLESYQLLANRIGQGHSQNQSHEHFSTNISKSYDTWRLILNADGTIYDIQPMTKDEAAGFWSLVEGTSAKSKRFPALRPVAPLFQLNANAVEWEQIKRISEKNLNEAKDLTKNIVEKLSEDSQNPQDFLDAWSFKAAPVLAWKADEDSASLLFLQQCVQSFGRFCGLSEANGWALPKKKDRHSHGAKVAEKLTPHLLKLLEKTTQVDQAKAIMAFLFGRRKEQKGKEPKIEIAVQLCIDLHLPDEPGNTLYTHRISKLVLNCLGTSNDSSVQGVCAISGKLAPLLKTKFPEWDTGLFKTPPYSKFAAAPCNQRYRRFELDAFDISSELARSLVGALQGMTDPSLEWKTWARLYNGKFKRETGKKPIPLKDLMLAYPSFDIDDLSTIDVFTHRQADAQESDTVLAKQFVNCAENVCSVLRKKSALHSEDGEYMRIMLVRAVSQGQIQLSYTASPNVREFISAVQSWSDSERNLPKGLKIPLPVTQSTTDFAWRTPRLLFPEEIGLSLTRQWTRDGSECSRIQGPPVGMVFDMFLRKRGAWESAAQNLLELALDRNEALLVGAGHALHRLNHGGEDPWKAWRNFIEKAHSGKDKHHPGYAIAQTISLIGSLLHIMNSHVEDYTNESAYLVGKLLAMMDELHKCYCEVVRDRDIPPALIGNGLLRRAGDSPAQALSDLHDRASIYLGWAKTAAISDKMSDQQKIAVHSARKVLRLAQPLVEKLHVETQLENELSSVSKAHLFLGYLSPVLGGDEE